MTDDDTTARDRPGRRIELSVEVPGDPEDVWRAVATGPGISSWFVPAEVGEAPGRDITLDFGSFGRDTAEVAVWDPPRRFTYQGGPDRPLVYEWTVEAAGGGSCTVRLVSSGFGEGDDSDGDHAGMSEGWPIFLQALRLHLTHFAGRTASASVPTVMTPGPLDAAWEALTGAIGVPVDAAPGTEVRSAEEAPPLAGVVDTTLTSAAARTHLLVLTEPAPGTAFLSAEGGDEAVACSVYLYLYGVDDIDEVRATWTDWLGSALPALAPAPSD